MASGSQSLRLGEINGILGPFVFHLVEKQYGSWDKQTMDQKTSTYDFDKNNSPNITPNNFE
jgi:hypothetical protein